MPDAKWLEILKASGWQTAALSLAFTAFLALANSGAIPPLAVLWVQLLAFGAVVCGFLAIGSLLAELSRVFPVHVWIARAQARRAQQAEVRAYIPCMTAKEREILGYLIAKNQRTFTCAQDGGHAMTLISRGIVTIALRPGQAFTVFDMPVTIPDHIWEVLLEHKDCFPAVTTRRHPWREAVI